jgi:NodT family efflux transporter outer membrane factor (OMF) lipoprotein
MRTLMTGRMLGLLMGAAALGACAVGPNYHAPRTSTPESFVAAAPSAPGASAATPATPSIDLAQWWRALHDPELDSLIERAIRGNPDIEIALTRLQEARTQLSGATSTILPQVGAGGGAAHGTGSDLARGRAPQTLVSAENTAGLARVEQIAGFDAGWEIDLFGKYRREIEAAKYDAQAAAWTRNAVLISVVADVARAYVDLRGLQLRLAITRQDAVSAQQFRDLVQTRYDRGLTNELDVTLANRELATLQAAVAPLLAQINATEYSIAVLLGQYPEELSAELTKPGVIPALPQAVEPGLPLDLLKRRPDIQEAERQLAAATARIGVATANLFPRLAITAGAGAQSATVGNAPSSHIWSVGPALYWPLLDFGALDALVSVADLQTHERLVSYQRTVFAAVRDADTAIGTFAAEQDRLTHLDDAMVASARAVSLASQRYDRGLTDFLNVVDAERQEYALESEYAATQQSAAEAFVALYRALGGGWEAYQDVPAIHQPLPAVLAVFRRLAMSEDPQR